MQMQTIFALAVSTALILAALAVGPDQLDKARYNGVRGEVIAISQAHSEWSLYTGKKFTSSQGMDEMVADQYYTCEPAPGTSGASLKCKLLSDGDVTVTASTNPQGLHFQGFSNKTVTKLLNDRMMDAVATDMDFDSDIRCSQAEGNESTDTGYQACAPCKTNATLESKNQCYVASDASISTAPTCDIPGETAPSTAKKADATKCVAINEATGFYMPG